MEKLARIEAGRKAMQEALQRTHQTEAESKAIELFMRFQDAYKAYKEADKAYGEATRRWVRAHKRMDEANKAMLAAQAELVTA